MLSAGGPSPLMFDVLLVCACLALLRIFCPVAFHDCCVMPQAVKIIEHLSLSPKLHARVSHHIMDNDNSIAIKRSSPDSLSKVPIRVRRLRTASTIDLNCCCSSIF